MNASIIRGRPELLAPAGDWESLRAAVANGADAVYFGLPQFNARYRATNFAIDDLPNICTYLHERGVKGYVTFNTLIFADEWPQVLAYLNALQQANVDAVIVQDWGLALVIHRLFPNLPIHASTQTTQTEARGIQLLQELGVERVIVARELSIAEIRKISSQTTMPVEVFVHGALCVSYSGQCLTSEALGGRSANRGQCAQACRMPYQLMVDGEQVDLGDRAYLISPQDLAAPDLVADLLDAGVCSFKIEGRLKGAAYVAATTQLYRTALNAAMEHRPYSIDSNQWRAAEQTFSRGLFHGFLDGVNHQITAPARFPKHRGIRIGQVIHVQPPWITIRLDHEQGDLSEWLKPGDGLVFDEGRPEEDEIGGRVFQVQEQPRQNRQRFVRLRMDRHQVHPQHIHAHAIVWKTDDPAVRQKLEQSFAKDKPIQRIGVHFSLQGQSGTPLTIHARTDEGDEAEASWPGPLEIARKQPTTLARITDALGRLHETPFALAAVHFDCQEPLLIPSSVLNQLRRQLVAILLSKHPSRRKKISHHEVSSLDLQKFRQSILPGPLNAPPQKEPQLHVLARNLDQVRFLAEMEHPPSLIYCDFEDVRRYREAVALARSQNVPIGLASLRIIKPGEETWLRIMAEARPDRVLVRNLATLRYFQANAPEIPLVGDYSLNVVNEFAAAWLKTQGLVRMVPGYDLNWEQLVALIQACPPDWFEVVIHYFMPMFHMEHCVFAAFLSQGKDYRDCGRPCDHHRLDLRDHQQAHFPVIPDAGCRNTVYNALPQSAAEFMPRMLQIGLRVFRLELLRESSEQIHSLIQLYREVLYGHNDGKDAWRKVRGLNQLGVTRGTLQLL